MAAIIKSIDRKIKRVIEELNDWKLQLSYIEPAL